MWHKTDLREKSRSSEFIAQKKEQKYEMWNENVTIKFL